MKKINDIDYELIPGTKFPLLELIPLQPEHADMVAGWIADEKARTWLDLGGGRQSMSTRELYMMLTSRRNHARLYKLPNDDQPLGLVCINDSSNLMLSADVWGVRGEYDKGPRNVSVAAFLMALATGFVDLNRKVMGSWIVEGNGLSIIMHKRIGLQETGRQRQRHIMHGKTLDRLLYDITLDEFSERYANVPSESGRTLADSMHDQILEIAHG